MQNRFSSLLLAGAGLVLTLVAGCGQHTPALQVGSKLSGNWAFTSTTPKLALNLGFTQGAYETVSAVARLNGSSCVTPTTNIVLTGSVGGSNQMTLVSAPFGGTVLTLRGDVATDGKGIANATWSFAGGNCGKFGKMAVTATNYTNIAGTYAGPFNDNSGNAGTIHAFLQQTSQPDQNGQFSLTGTASFPDNPCFVQQPTITYSVVTGSDLAMTYTDPGSSAVLTASGFFNSTATQLTITSWSIAGGPCNGDAGTGSMTEQ
jgi:hypothetical protein